MIHEPRTCVPELSVERSINDEPALQLRFRYGERSFTPGKRNQFAYPRLEHVEGKPVIYYFTRDLQLEQTYISLLEQWHFKQITDVQFVRTTEAGGYTFIDWLQQHKSELEACFSFVQTDTSLRFYLGDISLTQEISPSPDWFDIRITVRMGDFQFPFIRFRKHILEGKREFVLPDGKSPYCQKIGLRNIAICLLSAMTGPGRSESVRCIWELSLPWSRMNPYRRSMCRKNRLLFHQR